MRKKPNIDIYACNISSVHIYKYNKLIQIYPYKTELDLSRVRLNGCLNSCLARLMLFISVPFRPFRPFFPFFDRLNGQPFNFRLPPKQNSLPPFTI